MPEIDWQVNNPWNCKRHHLNLVVRPLTSMTSSRRGTSYHSHTYTCHIMEVKTDMTVPSRHASEFVLSSGALTIFFASLVINSEAISFVNIIFSLHVCERGRYQSARVFYFRNWNFLLRGGEGRGRGLIDRVHTSKYVWCKNMGNWEIFRPLWAFQEQRMRIVYWWMKTPDSLKWQLFFQSNSSNTTGSWRER